jgi:cephalosporin hydroxylase
MSEDFNVIQQNFAYNLAAHPAKNVTYIQKHSKHGLIDLINMGVKAELIYIDGDHKAAEVLTDLVLAWELLNVGGIMLCDDTTTWKYKDINGTQSSQMSPRLAVETFIQCNWHKLNVLSIPDGAQTAFIKIQE